MISKCAENYLSPGLKNYATFGYGEKERLSSDGRVNWRKRARKHLPAVRTRHTIT